MDNEDDEKRRVMTPPESWTGGGGSDALPEDLGDDSWLNDEELIPGMDEAIAAEDSQVAAPDPEEPAPEAMDEPVASDDAPAIDDADEPGDTQEDPGDWLGMAPAPDIDDAPATEPIEAPDPVDDAMMAAMEEPAPAPEPIDVPEPEPVVDMTAATNPVNTDSSPTDAVGVAAAQLMDEELSAGGNAVSDGDAAALLTDHSAVPTDKKSRGVSGGMIGTLAVLVLLLAGGGWWVFQERTAMQAEISRLETNLGNVQASNQGDLTAAQESALQEENQSLQLQLSTLREQYSAMASELDQLQAMVDVAQVPSSSEASNVVASSTEPAPEPVQESPEKSPQQPSEQSAPAKAPESIAIPAPTGGEWFVNVASYSRRDIAEEWAAKLEKELGSVQLQEVTVNGKPLFRVRAIGFANKAAAQEAANALETRYGIGPLWVGRDAPATAGTQPTSPPSVASSSTNTAVTSERPIQLDQSASDSGWFIFVDTYARGVEADARAREIRDAGYDAKVAVESRQGELFYRVQVVGIDSQAEGEATVKALAQLTELTNLQLRRY